jgi:transcriptional regulator with XRE-family HTH domain
MKVARVASDLDPEAVAAALGISRRTYDRVEAGDRPATRAELIVFSQLTNQDPSFFGVTSSSAAERAILSDLKPRVNGGGEAE